MQYARKKSAIVAFGAVLIMLLASFAVFAAEDSNAEIEKATVDAAGNTLKESYDYSRIITVGVGTLRWTSYFGHASDVVCIDAGDANAASWNGKAYRSLFSFDQAGLVAKMSGASITPSEDDLKNLGMAAHDHNGFSTSNLEALAKWDAKPTVMIMSDSIYSSSSDELKTGLSRVTDVVVIKEVDAFFGEGYALSEGFNQNLSILAAVFDDTARANQLSASITGIIADVQSVVKDRAPSYQKAFVAAASQSGSKDLTWSVGSYCPFDIIGLTNAFTGSTSTVAVNGGSEVMSAAQPDVIFADLSGTSKYGSDASAPVLVYANSKNTPVYPVLPYFWFGYNFDNALADAYLLAYYTYAGSMTFDECMAKIKAVYEAFYPEMTDGKAALDGFENYYSKSGSTLVIGNQYMVSSEKKFELSKVPTYSITDGRGNTVAFDSVPQHIISVGAGLNATLVQLGCLDKIVVADSYTATSASYDFPVFKDLRASFKDGKIYAAGNVYSSGKANLIADIIKATDEGKFDKTQDVILITGSNTYVPPIVDELRGYGFTKILTWADITEYGNIADFVDTISKVAVGKTSDGAQKMRELSAVIDAQIGSADKVEAMYVTYSSSTFKVGNTGSLANSMILAAGGNTITLGGGSGSTYAANITDLVEKHPNVVIFIDNSIASNETNLANFNELIKGSGVKVVALNPLWNNYSLESVDGIKAMATAMYPEIFAKGTEVPGESTVIVSGTDKLIITDDVIGDKDAVAVVLTDVTIRLPSAALDKMDSSAVSIEASSESVNDSTVADKIGKGLATDKVTKISIDITNVATTSNLGAVSVTVPFVQTESGSIVTAFCITSGGAEKLNTTYADGNVTFETTHFSDFVIVELEKDPTVEPETTYYMIAIVAVLAIIGIGALVISSKKH